MPRPPLLSKIVCYHCQSLETSKAGFDKGKQRYYCRACRRWFRENPVLLGGAKRKPRWRPKALPSKGHLILNLQAIAQRLGRTPTTNDIQEQSKAGGSYTLNNYYDVFGSFLEALKKANLKPNYKQRFDKEKLLNELRELHRKLKRPLLGKDVAAVRKKGKVSSAYHFQRAFGSVPKAIEAAGAGQKAYTRQEMIEILLRLDAKLYRPVQASDIDELYHQGKAPHHRTFEREFGGMGKARRAAGVNNFYKREPGLSRHWQKYTPEELIHQLKSLGKRLGRRPTDRDINKASKDGLCASSVTFARMCGSLPEAYRKAGFEQAKPRSYTNKEILAALKKLVREKGGMPTYHELVAASKAGKCPAPGTIVRRIGKLTDIKSKFSTDKSN
jgi:hypothetical protein